MLSKGQVFVGSFLTEEWPNEGKVKTNFLLQCYDTSLEEENAKGFVVMSVRWLYGCYLLMTE